MKVAASRVPPSSTPPSETCGQHSTPFTFYSRHLSTSPGPTQPSLLLLPQGIRGVSGPPAYWPPICYGAFGGVNRLFESRIFYIYMVDNLNCTTRTCLPLSLSLSPGHRGRSRPRVSGPPVDLSLSLPPSGAYGDVEVREPKAYPCFWALWESVTRQHKSSALAFSHSRSLSQTLHRHARPPLRTSCRIALL